MHSQAITYVDRLNRLQTVLELDMCKHVDSINRFFIPLSIFSEASILACSRNCETVSV